MCVHLSVATLTRAPLPSQPPAYTSIVSPTSNPMGGGSVAPAPAPPQPQPSVAKPPVPTPAYKPASVSQRRIVQASIKAGRAELVLCFCGMTQLPRIGSGGLSPAISDAKEYTYAAISAMNVSSFTVWLLSCRLVSHMWPSDRIV